MPLPRSLLRSDPPEDRDLQLISGTWPDGLTGELLLTGPHPDTFGGPHPFFGEGIIYRLSLEAGRHGASADAFAWRQRRVESPSARLRARRPELFTPTMVGVQSPFGHTNAANTGVLPWGDRLLLTWDAGRPVEIDPLTLEFLGDVGHRDDWATFDIGPQPVLPMIMSTAHPVIDPDRNVLWSVNTHWGELHVVRWDGAGPVQRWPIDGATIPQSVHTITQTREWLVVADCAYKVEPQTLDGGRRTEPANSSGPVYLIRKADLEAAAPGSAVRAQRHELAPENNHYYASYDDTDGITVIFEHTEAADIAMTQRVGDVDAWGRPCDPALAGLYGFPMAPDRTSLVVFDPERGELVHRAEQRQPDLLWSRQLNALDWSTEGRSAPTLHHTVHLGFRPEGITQEMVQLYRDRVDPASLPSAETPPLVASTSVTDLRLVAHHELAPDDLPTSPIFVPRGVSSPGDARSRYAGTEPGGHDGWVVVPILNDDGFRVEVYDAAHVDRGPLATAAAPAMVVPFVLHSAWMPRVVAADHGIERVRFADELARVDELPPELAEEARAVARDLDGRRPLVPTAPRSMA